MLVDLPTISQFFSLSVSIVAFTQPVVDAFDPRLLVAPAICHVLDFNTIKVVFIFLSFTSIFFLFDIEHFSSKRDIAMQFNTILISFNS